MMIKIECPCGGKIEMSGDGYKINDFITKFQTIHKKCFEDIPATMQMKIVSRTVQALKLEEETESEGT